MDIYIQFNKGFRLSNWDVTIEKTSTEILSETNEFPMFIIPNSIDDINELKGFIVITSKTRRMWFTRNNIDKYSEVCNLEEGKKINIDENKLIEIRSEIMGVINHIHNNDFGMALTRSEIIRDKINKLV